MSEIHKLKPAKSVDTLGLLDSINTDLNISMGMVHAQAQVLNGSGISNAHCSAMEHAFDLIRRAKENAGKLYQATRQAGAQQ